ncbi:hypothetical protein F5Y07DRAFT_387600 [Xylaria sp. FL0933]|nr:hypothetical protein F5Y07DRAFT_387600 [Xylaria sp. FL0933]
MVRQYNEDEVQQAHDRVYEEGRVAPEQCLPLGTSAAEFANILDEFRAVVGGDQVHTGKSLLHFSDPFTLDTNNFPSAAICPNSVEQIRQILCVANVRLCPLWVVSRGKNLGYGGPSPRVRGSVILSLYRMDRIIEVNEKSAFAVVEPGVTFFDLYSYCRNNKLALWPSVPAIAWGSVIGNTLDRGFGYTANGDHQNFICGMEVMMPNGELIRTGQWAVENGASAFHCKAGFGPQMDGLFLQSNLGIVTKLGISIQPQPETTMAISLDFDHPEDLGDLTEVIAELRRRDILQNDPSFFNVTRRISRLAPRHTLYNGSGAIPGDLITEIMKQQGWGYWKAWFNFYGSKEMVMARLAGVQGVVASRSPGARIAYRLFEGEGGEKVDPTTIPSEWQPLYAGVPSILYASTIDFNTPSGGYGGHMDFSPILPYNADLTCNWYKDVCEISRKHGFDSFVGGHGFAKHSVLVHMIMFNRMDKIQMDSAKALWVDLAKKAKEYGLVTYRTHLDHMDMVQNSYDFNKNAQRRLVETFKVRLV